MSTWARTVLLLWEPFREQSTAHKREGGVTRKQPSSQAECQPLSSWTKEHEVVCPDRAVICFPGPAPESREKQPGHYCVSIVSQAPAVSGKPLGAAVTSLITGALSRPLYLMSQSVGKEGFSNICIYTEVTSSKLLGSRHFLKALYNTYCSILHRYLLNLKSDELSQIMSWIYPSWGTIQEWYPNVSKDSYSHWIVIILMERLIGVLGNVGQSA